MIISFVDKNVENCWLRAQCDKIHYAVREAMIRKLDLLHFVSTLDELATIPGAHVQPLRKETSMFMLNVDQAWTLVFRYDSDVKGFRGVWLKSPEIVTPTAARETSEARIQNVIPVQPPLTPGEILYHEFLLPLELTQLELSKLMKVSPQRVHAIVNGNYEITTDTAIRLSKVFGVGAKFWLDAEQRNALWKILNDPNKASEYEEIKRLKASRAIKSN
jgi:antitoxin HigA-1